MKNSRRRLWTLALAVCAAWAVQTAAAQTAIAISNTQVLAFGRFAAGSGGTVTVGPGGARSASGGVILVSSGSGSAAQFSVSGDANATYAVSLPADGAVSLASGADGMAVNTFTSSPSPTGTLGAGGTQTLSVGATLTVGDNQPAGGYSGSFDVSVDYN